MEKPPRAQVDRPPSPAPPVTGRSRSVSLEDPTGRLGLPPATIAVSPAARWVPPDVRRVSTRYRISGLIPAAPAAETRLVPDGRCVHTRITGRLTKEVLDRVGIGALRLGSGAVETWLIELAEVRSRDDDARGRLFELLAGFRARGGERIVCVSDNPHLALMVASGCSLHALRYVRAASLADAHRLLAIALR